VKILLDSQVLVWLLYDPERVGVQSVKLIENAAAVYVSYLSLWELAIKFSKNKIKMPYSPGELLSGTEALGLECLNIRDDHLTRLPNIKTPHADPFDRMLIAQTEAEGCYLLTSDRELLSTKYKTLPATT